MQSSNQETCPTVPKLHKCSSCSLSKMCIPDHMTGAGLDELESFMDSSLLYKDSELIFSAGQPFEKVFAVKSGMVKTVMLNHDGSEHIDGFYLPGEVFALDAIYPETYLSTAYSIGTSSVCNIHYDALTHLASHLPQLQQQLFGLLSNAVSKSHQYRGDMPAEQKLACFILDLSRRFKQRGYSDTRMNLTMPRRDIASHLNMAPETVSRLFKRFQKEGIFSIKRNDLKILDNATLCAISEGYHSTRQSMQDLERLENFGALKA